ncbi:DMT family transporter [Acaryochloris sp. IP29b_bin.148]|uniref:DMT family transporter n=1 Tax=Acaryochloris sp. IP29b_bin.148 TaxID=2969218 RepID=UPI00260F17A1|nr:DMT family transporter [Acaryochloris sp. IP29b_bin.148]
MLNPTFLLVLSRALRSLGTPLIAFLLANAPTLAGQVMNPISFCNVLFLGNLCAALVVLARFGWQPIWQDWQHLPPRVRLGLGINGCLAVVVSALIFLALMDTSVTNTVLLGRLGPVIYALAGSLWFRQRITRAEWIGFSLIAAGVVALALQHNQFQFSRGDGLIIASAFVYAISAMVSKVLLAKSSSLRVVVFTRNAVAAVVFFAIAIHLFGPAHFIDIFSGQLWLIMLIYALFVIVISQFAWFAALKQLDSRTVARWTVLSPIFGIVYAFILNGERPSQIQGMALIIIMVGVLISNVRKSQPKGLPESGENSLSAA